MTEAKKVAQSILDCGDLLEAEAQILAYVAKRVAEARVHEHETSCWQCREELEGHCDRRVELSAALAAARKG